MIVLDSYDELFLRLLPNTQMLNHKIGWLSYLASWCEAESRVYNLLAEVSIRLPFAANKWFNISAGYRVLRVSMGQ